MSEDARFEDARSGPVRLRAFDAADLQVISALVQDAVFTSADMTWRRGERRFAVLLNRIRWEEGRAQAERVRSVLVLEDVTGVASQGVRRDADLVLALLSLGWVPGPDGTGHVELMLAGDGGVRVAVEALEVTLRDVTRPYAPVSGKLPRHPA